MEQKFEDKNLIGKYKYKDLVNNESIYLDRELTNEELNNLKYINDEMVITLNIDNFEHINVINDKLNLLGKNNNIKIKLNDKEKFNEYIFNNNIHGKNIFILTSAAESVSLEEYLKLEKLLYLMVKDTNNLSPFEKYIYAYNITKQFKEYKDSPKLSDSRNLYSILKSDYMVCVGYSNLFGDLLNKMGIENKELYIGIDDSYDFVSKYEIQFNNPVPVNFGIHARRYVHIVDEKYNIDGYYVADPTWDNDLKYDYYNHLAMTDNETTFSRYYQRLQYNDLFNVNNMSEFIEKVNRLKNNRDYDSFACQLSFVLGILKEIDVKTFNNLKEKYEYIDKDSELWPDNITSFVYDLGSEILKKVNKTISSDTIMEAVGNVYRHSYGYNEEELNSVLKEVREENIERQEKLFPTRYRINKDGTDEVLMNENNKFDGVKKM